MLYSAIMCREGRDKGEAGGKTFACFTGIEAVLTRLEVSLAPA